jgi:FdhD protein
VLDDVGFAQLGCYGSDIATPAIDALAADGLRVETDHAVAVETLMRLPERLREAQEVFDRTGGLHAAGLFDTGGSLIAAGEDVGRHNAVDKVLGARWLAGDWPLDRATLCVSGRVSYEIALKALVAGIPIVAAVSAPTSLAIDLAERAGLSLVGFVREGRMNVYTHERRLRRVEPGIVECRDDEPPTLTRERDARLC